MNTFLSRKISVLFIAAVLLRIYLGGNESQETTRPLMKDNNNSSLDVYRDLKSRHSITEQSLNTSKVESAVYQQKKIFLALHYWEQLTMATNNFLHLTALAVQGGRQVVVPFVKDSQFLGVPTLHRHQLYNTLGLYYNVTALNESLRLHGHGTLINWEGFQDVCKGKLDVLIYFYYSKLSSSTYPPCNLDRKEVFVGIKIGRRICVDANTINSVQRFEEEILKRLPCVGIFEWRGVIKTTPKRTHFDIESKVERLLSYRDMSAFFSAKLLRVARDFIAQHLTSNFISVHIRTEKILCAGGNISTVERCFFKLRKRLLSIIEVATVPGPAIFLAADFTKFGSSSATVKPARKHAKFLKKILLPIRPIVFQPSEYKIVDRGALAIVEMNILATGRRLFVLGSGSFQLWITTQFLTNNKNDQSKVERLVC